MSDASTVIYEHKVLASPFYVARYVVELEEETKGFVKGHIAYHRTEWRPDAGAKISSYPVSLIGLTTASLERWGLSSEWGSVEGVEADASLSLSQHTKEGEAPLSAEIWGAVYGEAIVKLWAEVKE